MSAEIVPVENMAALETLEPADREVAVTKMLAEARSWLAHAVEATEPARVAEFKAFVATIAETTRQLNLSKEIQLDAAEMVRRAERGVGVAIRKGQAEGTVRRRGQKDAVFDRWNGKLVETANSMPSPYDFAEKDDLSGNGAGIYHLADGVSDEQFEEALTEAKAEGNLSRANVVRKIKQQPVPATRPEILRKKRRISAERVITETIAALDGLAIGLSYVDNLAAIEPAQAAEWSASQRTSSAPQRATTRSRT